MISAFGFLLLLGANQACSPVFFETGDKTNQKIEDGTPDDPVDPLEPVTPAEACYTDSFNQPTAKVGKLDILFVTDTSGSLDVERAAIADGIDSFVAGLSNDVDYNIAVMLGHGSRSSYKGKLYQQVATEPAVLTKSMGLTTIRTILKNKLTKVAVDTYSDGGEEGLYSLFQGVTTPALLTQSQTAGFFRPDAALAVVFISDENDICAVYPAGVTPVVDTNNNEVPSKALDCGGITPDTVYAKLKELKGDKPVLISSVIYVAGKPVPVGGENEIGYGYLEATQLSKGLSVYLGGTNTEIANGLGDIGKLADSQLTLILKHTLANTGTPSSVGVKVDGKDSLFNYDSVTREVNLLEPGGSGSLVDINYCIPQ